MIIASIGGDDVQLVEQRVIKKGHLAYNQINTMSFAAKNLWNTAQYCVRQSFIYGNGVPSYNQMDKLMQPTIQYLHELAGRRTA